MRNDYETLEEIQAEDIRNEQFNADLRAAILMANQDCRDPDHPGCERCDDEE